ncbi:hypothetical protein [Frateuria terrea]|uniref:Uncharacterized protein n=1 Tax=Frateuria terrea TaxID=529704 RepID=A0A1H6QK58_9GAMM|nr:hypothetical protein [Frateuria terrea]SEI43973.1 hypothetical protein SAMN04487997_0670 [Frateuria terrea]
MGKLRSHGRRAFFIATLQGKKMKDTIELLEAIGRDASLRHTPADEMAHLLGQAQASAALVAAAASGDSSQLTAEFGQLSNQAPQVTQMPAREEEEPAEEEPLEIPAPGSQS